MNREMAERLMEIYTRVGETLSEAESIVLSEPDPNVRKKLMTALGGQMAGLWVELQWPLVREFPHLDPDDRQESLKSTPPED
jgi:hypothetical protein